MATMYTEAVRLLVTRIMKYLHMRIKYTLNTEQLWIQFMVLSLQYNLSGSPKIDYVCELADQSSLCY